MHQDAHEFLNLVFGDFEPVLGVNVPNESALSVGGRAFSVKACFVASVYCSPATVSGRSTT
jgi:hypothetical protein